MKSRCRPNIYWELKERGAFYVRWDGWYIPNPERKEPWHDSLEPRTVKFIGKTSKDTMLFMEGYITK